MKKLYSALITVGFFLSLHGVSLNDQLQSAAQRGDSKQVEDILRNAPKGAIDINVRSTGGFTPLHSAAIRDDEQLAALLINNGAQVNVQNNAGTTPLHFAVIRNNEKMTALLIRNGANINIQNNDGDTPLHLAIQNSYMPIIRLLLSQGADISKLNKYSQTAVDTARTEMRPAIVQLIENYERFKATSQP